MRRQLLLIALLAACASPTELVLVVDSNLGTPTELDEVVVTVTGPDGTETRTPQALGTPGGPALPLTLGIAPDGDSLGPIRIAAIGQLDGDEVVRQEATLTLPSGRRTTLRLLLLRSCVGRTCPGTCSEAGCVDLARDALPEWSGQPEPLPDDPCLASPFDVDGDGEGSAACGGADCDDADATVGPGAEEACGDEADGDCDGVVDEGCAVGCADGETEACMTSCGGVGERSCMDGVWDACAAETDPCNYLDDDCDGLVDEGQTYVTQNERAVVDGNVFARHPHLVWTGDGYGLVWDEVAALTGDGSISEPRLRVLDRDGAPRGTPLTLGVNGALPRAAWSGSVFAVIYVGCEGTAACTGVRLQLATADATATVGTPQQLDVNNDGDPRPRVVWDGTVFATASYDPPDVEVSFFGEDGTRAGAMLSTGFGVMRPDVTASDGGLLFVDSSGFGLRVGRGDTSALPMAFTSVQTGGDFQRPSVVATDAGSALGWTTLGSEVGALILDGADTVVGTPQTLSADRAPVRNMDLDDAQVGLAAAPGQVIATWLEDSGPDTPQYARLSTDGSVLQPSMPVASVGAPSAHVVPAWSGAGFGVVWSQREGLVRSHIRFARLVCPGLP